MFNRIKKIVFAAFFMSVILLFSNVFGQNRKMVEMPIDRIKNANLLKSNQNQVDFSQFNGLRVKTPSDPKIYLVDQGKRRWIPNPETFNNLFRNWNVYVGIDIINIPEGTPITNGAFLAKCNAAPVYLIDNGTKRHVASPSVMDKYNFSWPQPNTPCLALDYIPTGPQIN